VLLNSVVSYQNR